MQIQLNDPTAVATLVSALQESDCLAAQTAADTVDVYFPWLEDSHDAEQARLELTFFLRAWTRRHWPNLRADIVA